MIIFLYGEDTFRSRKKLKELKEKFLHDVDPSGNSLVELDGTKITLEKINEAAAPQSLFVRKRMIIIENIFKSKSKTLNEQILAFISARERTADDNILVFWDEDISAAERKTKLFLFFAKLQFAQEFRKMNNLETAAWLRKYAADNGAQIREAAVSQLISFFGSDLWQLSNEVDKLAAFKKGKGETIIEVADVDEMCHGQVDANIFALTDAIGARNLGRSLELLEQELEAGVVEAVILTMILRHIKILIQIREALDDGLNHREIISKSKLHPFVAQKSEVQARNFSLDHLKKLFAELVEIDAKVKTGRGNAVALIEVLLAR